MELLAAIRKRLDQAKAEDVVKHSVNTHYAASQLVASLFSHEERFV